MNKWECIYEISKQGRAAGNDTVLQLLEWSDKPCTDAVTEDEAREFLRLLQDRRAVSSTSGQLASAE